MEFTGSVLGLILGVTSGFTSVSVIDFIYTCVLVVVMASLASYMLWRMSIVRLSDAKVMQKNVGEFHDQGTLNG
jgi:hypothetical protein